MITYKVEVNNCFRSPRIYVTATAGVSKAVGVSYYDCPIMESFDDFRRGVVLAKSRASANLLKKMEGKSE